MVNIENVEEFWDNNPVHTKEISSLESLKAFSDNCDLLVGITMIFLRKPIFMRF